MLLVAHMTRGGRSSTAGRAVPRSHCQRDADGTLRRERSRYPFRIGASELRAGRRPQLAARGIAVVPGRS
jgi:hypothetical protein